MTEAGKKSEDEANVLPRRIGGWSLAAITVGIVVGSGIFRTPSTIAGLTGTALGALSVWVIGGIVTLALALCLAELAAMYPRTGGIYVYLEESFGKPIAFVFGWTFLLINPANWAAVALIFAGYVGAVLRVSPVETKMLATGAIVFASLVNIVSVRLANQFNWLFTVVKVAALVAIAVAIFTLHQRAGGHAPPSLQTGTVGTYGLAIIACLWPFEGVAAASAMAGEVRRPERNLALGLIGGVAAVTAIYLVLNAAFLYALSATGVARSEHVAFDAAAVVFGSSGASIIAAAAVVATFGALIAGATCDPRILFAISSDGLFFKAMSKCHRRFQTPHVAILLSCVFAIAYVWISSFEQLAAQFVLGMWPFYALCVLGLMRLRKTRRDLARPYRAPLYPMLPIVFLCGSLGLLLNSLLELPTTSLANFALMLIGFPTYFIWTRWQMRAPHRERATAGR